MAWRDGIGIDSANFEIEGVRGWFDDVFPLVAPIGEYVEPDLLDEFNHLEFVSHFAPAQKYALDALL